MRIRTQCRDCGLPFRTKLEEGVTCPNCGVETPVAEDGWTERSVETCPLCECRHLYRQRDINRAWGCLLVVIGAIFVPWTYGLSLVLLSLVDFLVYRKLRNAVVCYRCDTVYRDAVPGERQGEFDLLKHDVLKYGKTWDETRTPESPG
jgi:hypothetical protein